MKVDLRAEPYQAEKKGDVKRLRREGKIPAVLYGHGEKTKQLCIEHKDFKKILNLLKKEVVTINLLVENKNYSCLIKSIQHNPINDELLHVDFQHIHKKEKIKATIPVHAIGEAPGTKDGGILNIHLHEVMIKCLPDEMPSRIDVDISNLRLGQTIHLKDIKLPNVEFELALETPVVSVLIPKKVEEVAKPVVAEEAVGVGPEEGKEGAPAKEGEKGKEPEKGREVEKGKEGERRKEAEKGKESKR